MFTARSISDGWVPYLLILDSNAVGQLGAGLSYIVFSAGSTSHAINQIFGFTRHVGPYSEYFSTFRDGQVPQRGSIHLKTVGLLQMKIWLWLEVFFQVPRLTSTVDDIF
jgi:hypothetical protein